MTDLNYEEVIERVRSHQATSHDDFNRDYVSQLQDDIADALALLKQQHEALQGPVEDAEVIHAIEYLDNFGCYRNGVEAFKGDKLIGAADLIKRLARAARLGKAMSKIADRERKRADELQARIDALEAKPSITLIMRMEKRIEALESEIFECDNNPDFHGHSFIKPGPGRGE